MEGFDPGNGDQGRGFAFRDADGLDYRRAAPNAIGGFFPRDAADSAAKSGAT